MPVNISSPSVPFADVKSYGATGNGTTDDTVAIQNAINATARNVVLFFSKPSVYYRITGHLLLQTGLRIMSNGAILFKDSIADSANTSAIFYNTAATTNVYIQGLILKSINNQTGDGFQTGSLTSNVFATSLTNITDFYMKDVDIYNMTTGIKFSGTLSNRIFIENVNIFNTATSIYMSNVKDIHIDRCILDGTGFNNTHLHGMYFETTVSNLYITDCHCQNNVAGSGIQIYNTAGTGAKDVQIIGCSVDNGATGFIIQAGANNVVVDGFTFRSVTRGFSLDTTDNIQISNGTIHLISNIADINAACTNISFSNIVVNGSTQTTSNFMFVVSSGVNLIFDNIHCHDLAATTKIVQSVGSSSAATQCSFQNSSFQWTSGITGDAFTIRNTSDIWLIQDNNFINLGSASHHLNSNKGSPTPFVTFRGNRSYGFDNILDSDDTGTTVFDHFYYETNSITTTGSSSLRVVTMADATSFTPNSDTSDIAKQTNTQILGTLTANAPTGTPTDGRLLQINIKSTNIQTFAWNAIYTGCATTALPTASTGGTKTDKFFFQYNSTSSKWEILNAEFGY